MGGVKGSDDPFDGSMYDGATERCDVYEVGIAMSIPERWIRRIAEHPLKWALLHLAETRVTPEFERRGPDASRPYDS